MSKRKGIPKKTRFEVFKRDSFTCQYCGKSAPDVILEVDHIHPVSKDGSNDILNLITSCKDCNSGKSDRLLSDDSVVAKQKAQLDELNERREQLEMMLEWRDVLKSIDERALEAARREWSEVTNGWGLNERGMLSLKKLIDKFGLNDVLDAMQKAANYLKLDEEGGFTQESVETAFKKLGGICRLARQPEWKRELYYIRGILRNRLTYCNDWQSIQIMESAIDKGGDIEELRKIALSCSSWTNFKNQVLEYIDWLEEDTEEE